MLILYVSVSLFLYSLTECDLILLLNKNSITLKLYFSFPIPFTRFCERNSRVDRLSIWNTCVIFTVDYSRQSKVGNFVKGGSIVVTRKVTKVWIKSEWRNIEGCRKKSIYHTVRSNSFYLSNTLIAFNILIS